jgi:molybdate transport system substrate-binding protein
MPYRSQVSRVVGTQPRGACVVSTLPASRDARGGAKEQGEGDRVVAKLTVMCARSMHGAVGVLGRDFAQAAGHEIAYDFGTVGALQEKLDAGETADVVILGAGAIAALDAAGRLRAETRVPLARTFIALCIPAGAPAPAISTAEAFRRLIEQARAIAISDPAVGGSAGVHLARMFEREGLAPLVAAKALPQQSGVEVARRVVEGRAEFGLTLSGEIASVPGAAIAGPLPAPFGQDTVYWAAVMATSRAPAAAGALIAALRRPKARDIWAKAGFELP